MKAKCVGVLFGVLILAGLFSHSFAQVEWIVSGDLKISEPILDFTVSPDGKHFFVLTKGGNISIYDRDGKPAGNIITGEAADRISIGADGSQIFLSDNQTGMIKWLDFDFIFDINLLGSPYKGTPEAPVVLAVFSDFQ